MKSITEYGAISGGFDCTLAIAQALAENQIVYIPKGEWHVSSIVIDKDFTTIMTEGLETVIVQKTGNNTKRIIDIRASYVRINDISVRGQIDTEVGEQNHAVFIQSSIKNINHVKLSNIYAENIAGDVLYIGATLGYMSSHIQVASVMGYNILRNVVSLTGCMFVDINEIISIDKIGYTTLDIESNSVKVSDVIINRVYGHVVKCVSPSSLLVSERIVINQCELYGDKIANSTPAYTYYNTSTAIELRNVRGLRIKQCSIKNYTGIGVNYIKSIGDIYGEGIVFDWMRCENCNMAETTYLSSINFSNVISAVIDYFEVVLYNDTKIGILGSTHINSSYFFGTIIGNGRLGKYLYNCVIVKAICTKNNSVVFQQLHNSIIKNISGVCAFVLSYSSLVNVASITLSNSGITEGNGCSNITNYFLMD